jgi:hypothetical protein
MRVFKKPSDLDKFALQRMTELQAWMTEQSEVDAAAQQRQQKLLHQPIEPTTWILKDAVANRGDSLLVLYSAENVTQVSSVAHKPAEQRIATTTVAGVALAAHVVPVRARVRFARTCDDLQKNGVFQQAGGRFAACVRACAGSCATKVFGWCRPCPACVC